MAQLRFPSTGQVRLVQVRGAQQLCIQRSAARHIGRGAERIRICVMGKTCLVRRLVVRWVRGSVGVSCPVRQGLPVSDGLVNDTD